MKEALAAVFTAPDTPFSLVSYPIAPPQPGSALVEMEASGVCGTDVHIHRGRLNVGSPLIIGHEMVGRVAALPAGEQGGLQVGDRVIVNVAAPCGHCLLCRQGDGANCLNMAVTYTKAPQEAPHLHGGYASHCYAPIQNLIPVPDGLEPVPVCVFACTGSTVLHAMRLCRDAGLGDVETAVVQGTGPMGMFAILYLHSLGVKRLIAVTYDASPEQQRHIRGFGATDVLLLRDGEAEALAFVHSATAGVGADFVMECSGNPAAFPQGLQMLRNRGVYAVPGQYSNAPEVPVPAQAITFKALRVIGSSQYDNGDVRAYLDFMLKNPSLHSSIASLAACYPLSRVNDAMADAKAGRNVKTMLVKE